MEEEIPAKLVFKARISGSLCIKLPYQHRKDQLPTSKIKLKAEEPEKCFKAGGNPINGLLMLIC